MEKSYVYWVHRVCQANIALHGYVGVAKTSYKKRWGEHKRESKLGTHKNPHFSRAIEKYVDLVWEVVFTGKYEDCLELESSYRPSPSIGWNLAQGGQVSPMLGRSHTEEVVQKLKKFRHSEETKQLLKEINTGENSHRYGTTHSEETKRKMSVSSPKRKQIMCVETNEIFESVADAAKYVGAKGHSGLARAARKGTKAKGFHWKYLIE